MNRRMSWYAQQTFIIASLALGVAVEIQFVPERVNRPALSPQSGSVPHLQR